MWHHTLIVLLAFSTAIPQDVVQAAMSMDQVKEVVDDILEKMRQYGPLIVKLIAPFVAKKLVEMGVIAIGNMAVNSIGKRDAVVTAETEIEAAQKYLLQKYNDVIDELKKEIHERIDMEAVHDHIENAQEIISSVYQAVRDRIVAFVKQIAASDFISKIVERVISKRSEDVKHYDSVIMRLVEELHKKLGETPRPIA